MLDDLNRPLGLDRPAQPERNRPGKGRIFGVLALGAILAGSAATAYFQPELQRTAFQPETALPPPAEIAVTSAPLPPIETRRQRPTSDEPPDAFEGQISVREPTSLRQEPRFAHVADPALLEDGAFGPLPIRAADGRRPFDVYAGEAAGLPGPRVAVIVGGLGISQTGTQSAIQALPPAITLAFAPAGNSLNRWMQEARRKGHEILLQTPLEPFGYPQTSPGPHTLTVSDASSGNLNELSWSLGRMTNYVGVMNYMGARFSAEPEAMRQLFGDLNRRGLLYLDDASSTRSLAEAVAAESGVPFAGADILLDRSPKPEAIRRQLDVLERTARAQGSAIGVASAFEPSVRAIADWAAAAGGRGIVIVPVSALARDPESR